MKTVMILVAGGKGVRAGGDAPKQYRRVAGKALMTHALDAAAASPQIDAIQPVIGAGHDAHFQAALHAATPDAQAKTRTPVVGGASRQQSVAAGLAASEAEIVLVHDAARPFLKAETIKALLDKLEQGVGALPVLPLPDSLKRVADERITEEVDRTNVVRAQTPQVFFASDLRDVFAQVPEDAFTDEASAARQAGLQIVSVPGDEALFKVTLPEDFTKAERYLMTMRSDVRTGMGFDVHAFEPGDHVTLCGVDVPHSAKLKGHSDADVGLHALTDALLGAIGAGDIGDHFPPTDPQWAGVASHRFLEHAAQLIADTGGLISNVDVTLICERPKVSPYRAQMVSAIADWLKIEEARVSVKATTTEKLGFTGRKEGIAAQAVASVRLP